MKNSLKRRDFIKSTSLASASLVLGNFANFSCAQTERPNILWILAEDFGPDLGCYGNQLVRTPNIDRLASEGMRCTNAFVTAPVCSPSRSALITGMYQTSIDAHQHRSHRDDGYKLPEPIKIITEYFRAAGYFTANVTTPAPGIKGTGKTDFNFNVEKPFDGTDWNQRKPGQPFYAQINFNETHRTFPENVPNPVDPEKVEFPPYYPDHPITRKDWAQYLDSTNRLDEKVGAVLKRLEEEKLLENTVIFFFGDNGQAHVRGKQWLYDGGIHVPLIVRWPGKIKPGTVSDDLISSIDITAASLAIAGIPIPKYMDGRDFLNPRTPKREFIIAARDRCDETVDRIRCVRTMQFKYINNFYPERPYTQINRYKEVQYPVMRLMRRLLAAGKLDSIQAKFMAPTRPAEELYDIQKDPYEINNLAGQPASAAIIDEMRGILQQWIKETGDKGQYPEDPAIAAKWEKEQSQKWDGALQKIYDAERKLD